MYRRRQDQQSYPVHPSQQGYPQKGYPVHPSQQGYPQQGYPQKPRVYTCRTRGCGFKDSDTRTMDRHIELHHRGLRICKKCGIEGYETQEELVQHLKDMHPVLIDCEKCGEKIPKHKIQDHLKDAHPYMTTCRYCGKEIKMDDIKEHSEKHIKNGDVIPGEELELDDSDMEDEEYEVPEIKERKLTDESFKESIMIFMATGLQGVDSLTHRYSTLISMRKLIKRYANQLKKEADLKSRLGE